jgi:hypothetical protein
MHDKPEALDHAAFHEGLKTLNHVFLGIPYLAGDFRIGAWPDGQTVLQSLKKHEIIAANPAASMCLEASCFRSAPDGIAITKREAQINMIGSAQWQIEHFQAGLVFDPIECIVDCPPVTARHHEPEIEMVLALIIVIDAGLGIDQLRYFFQPPRWDGQRRKRAGSGCIWRHHSADA